MTQNLEATRRKSAAVLISSILQTQVDVKQLEDQLATVIKRLNNFHSDLKGTLVQGRILKTRSELKVLTFYYDGKVYLYDVGSEILKLDPDAVVLDRIQEPPSVVRDCLPS